MPRPQSPRTIHAGHGFSIALNQLFASTNCVHACVQDGTTRNIGDWYIGGMYTEF